MLTPMAAVIALVLALPPARAGEVGPTQKIPEAPELALPAIGPTAVAPHDVDLILLDLAKPDLTAAAAAEKLERLASVAAAAPTALAPSHWARVEALRAELPTRFVDQPETSRVLGEKMARLAATLQGLPSGDSYLREVDGRRIGVVRIESLFGKPVPVIDVSDYVLETPSHSAPDLNVFSLNGVFAKPKSFLGFGRPNVYFAFPQKDGYHKFDAKSLWREESKVIPAKGRAQSGILLVFKDFDQAALDENARVAKAHEGSRRPTCVNANCLAMKDMGFSVGKDAPIEKFYFPMPLLRAILEKGLYYKGRPVAYDLVRTTPNYLEDYYQEVDMSVKMTLWRHAQRGYGKSSAAKPAQPVPQKTPPSPTARFPIDARPSRDYDVIVSQPSWLGYRMRLKWGAHTLFRVEQSKVDIDRFLPATLKEFPQERPSLLTRIKKRILFARPVVGFLRSHLARTFRRFSRVSDAELFEMMAVDSPSAPNRYNIYFDKTGVSVMKIDGRAKTIDWILSKHVLMSGYSPDVRFAGEVWKGEDGKIYLSNNSGTYRPSDAQLESAAAYMRTLFPNVSFVIVRNPG